MATDKTIHLLIIHEFEEEAEKILSILRNYQIPVRPSRCLDYDSMLDTLGTKRIDIILVDQKQQGLPLPRVIQGVAKNGKDIPIITLLDNLTNDSVYDSIESGAEIVCCPLVPEHFTRIINQTFCSLSTRRDLRRIEVELNDAEKRTSQLLESSKDAIAYIHDGFHVYMNSAYIDFFEGEDADELAITPFLDLIIKSEVQKAKTLLKDIAADRVPQGEVGMDFKTLQGKEVKAVITLSKATYDGEPCIQFLVQPPKGNAQAEKELEMIKNKDIMTGYFNRSYFINNLKEQINVIKSGKDLIQSLMYIQLDNASGISKELGKGKFDLLIADITKFFQENLDSNLIFTRYEESTFIIQVPQKIESTTKIAENLVKKTSEQLFSAGEKTLNCSISLSITQLVEQSKNTDEILFILSNEMDKIIEKGGNDISVFDPAEEEKKALQANQEWIKAIEKGIKNKGFFLNYQQIASLHGDETEHYEVLIRLNNEGEIIMPNQFINVAKKYGLIHDIDRHLVTNAVDVIKEKNSKVGLFIKISVDSLCDQTFPSWLAELIKDRGILAERLIFQITESDLITNSKSIKPVIEALHAINCKITIEKFGIGLNSFNLIKQFPVDYLKLDPSINKDLDTNVESQQKAKEIIDQSHALNKLVIFERIEDASTMSVLWKLSANYVQGHFIGKVSQSMNQG